MSVFWANFRVSAKKCPQKKDCDEKTGISVESDLIVDERNFGGMSFNAQNNLGR